MNINPDSARIANQRRHERVYGKDRQLQIKSGNQEGSTSNWSQGGFLSDGLDDHHRNDQVEGTIEGPGRNAGRFTGRVIRVQSDGQRAVQLVSFDSATLIAMQGAKNEDENEDENETNSLLLRAKNLRRAALQKSGL